MIALVILLSIAFIGLWLNFIKFNNGYWEKAYLEQRREACKPHSWSYNFQDKLQCTRCGFVAGIILDEEES